MSDTTIAIICNKAPIENYFCFTEFLKSIEHFNTVIIGWGTNEYQNLSDRPRMFYNAIEQGHIKTKNLILSDCWDLIYVDSPEVIFEKHKLNNCDITISAEKNCFPDNLKDYFDSVALHDAPNSTYKYLNCGTVVGTTEAIFAMLKDMDATNKPKDYFMPEEQRMHHYNEQLWYQESFVGQPVSIKLDYSQNIANCLQNVTIDELDFTEERIKNIECGTYPSAFHWNGGSKTMGTMQPILEHLKLR